MLVSGTIWEQELGHQPWKAFVGSQAAGLCNVINMVCLIYFYKYVLGSVGLQELHGAAWKGSCRADGSPVHSQCGAWFLSARL